MRLTVGRKASQLVGSLICCTLCYNAFNFFFLSFKTIIEECVVKLQSLCVG